MNKTVLQSAIVAASVVGASQATAGALSFDTYGALGNTQYHSEMVHVSLYAGADGSATTNTTESQTLWLSQRDATEGLTNRTINCANDASGNPINVGESWQAFANNTYLSVYGGQIPTPQGLFSGACEIDIGAQGEVLGGYQTSIPTSFTAFTISSFTLYDTPRRVVSYVGTCAGIDVTTAQATSALYDSEIASGPIAPGGLDQPSIGLPAGCTTNGISRVALGYCDPVESDAAACQTGSSKAVPVPAFAAGALAVGLAGISLLTGRRKNKA